LSTYFATIFGVNAVDVAAVAVARASKSSGSSGSPPSFNVGAQCLKPWILQDVSPDGDPYGKEDLGTLVICMTIKVNGSSKWGIIAPAPPHRTTEVPLRWWQLSTVYYDNIVQCNRIRTTVMGVMINDVPGNKVGKTQDGAET
jgi:hypothetical protein